MTSTQVEERFRKGQDQERGAFSQKAKDKVRSAHNRLVQAGAGRGCGVGSRKDPTERSGSERQGSGPEGSTPWTVMWTQRKRGGGWSETILKGSGLGFPPDCDRLPPRVHMPIHA